MTRRQRLSPLLQSVGSGVREWRVAQCVKFSDHQAFYSTTFFEACKRRLDLHMQLLANDTVSFWKHCLQPTPYEPKFAHSHSLLQVDTPCLPRYLRPSDNGLIGRSAAEQPDFARHPWLSTHVIMQPNANKSTVY